MLRGHPAQMKHEGSTDLSALHGRFRFGPVEAGPQFVAFLLQRFESPRRSVHVAYVATLLQAWSLKRKPTHLVIFMHLIHSVSLKNVSGWDYVLFSLTFMNLMASVNYATSSGGPNKNCNRNNLFQISHQDGQCNYCVVLKLTLP